VLLDLGVQQHRTSIPGKEFFIFATQVSTQQRDEQIFLIWSWCSRLAFADGNL
jgi:hypothetical protein